MTSSTANSLRYWMPSSAVVHFPGEFTRSSLNGWVSCPHTWEEPSPETATCCLLSNSSLNSTVSSKGSQLLGSPTFQLLTAGPVTPASEQPGSNPLTWLAAVILPHVSKFWWGQGPGSFRFLSEFSHSFLPFLSRRTFFQSFLRLSWSARPQTHTLTSNSRRHDYRNSQRYLNKHAQCAFGNYFFETKRLTLDYYSTTTVRNLFNNCDGKQSVTCFWVGPFFVKCPAEKNSGYYITRGERGGGRGERKKKGTQKNPHNSKPEGKKISRHLILLCFEHLLLSEVFFQS